MNQHQPSQRRQCAFVFLIVAVLCVGCWRKTKPPEEPPTKPPEPRYTKDTMIKIESEGYLYLARITENVLPDAKEAPVHIFTPHLQKKIGDTIPIKGVKSIREAPETGWGTRTVAAEYFDSTKWNFEWEVTEMEDHYLLPEKLQGVRRVEFANIRFPIPIKR